MIEVPLGPRTYQVAFSVDVPSFASFLKARLTSRTVFIVSDENLTSIGNSLATELTENGFQCRLAAVPPGENSKCLAAAAYLYERLAWIPADRQTIVVAVGGGMIGDLAGFVAATYNRGLPLVIVPTTLLAMVDSSIGGKVGINLPQGKNLVGAIHQPAGVWIDLNLLSTLPEREYRSGLAEVVKYGLGLDGEFFAWLECNSAKVMAREPSCVSHMIETCCRLKAQIVSEDEREVSGLRAVLNLGHTFGHAFETVGQFNWTHGEAVAAGLVCACRLAERQNRFSSANTERVIRILESFQLPTRVPAPRAIEEWMAAMHRDKKNVSGRIRFVLPVRIGMAEIVENVPPEVAQHVLML